MPEPRSRKSQRTREKIFDAAAKLMKEKGEDYATVANICEEAGISKGTFFYHFKGKDELLRYYLMERFDSYLVEKQAADADRTDVYAYLLGLFDSYAAYCEEAGIEFITSYYTPRNHALDMSVTMGGGKMNILMSEAIRSLELAVANGYVRSDWSPQQIAFDLCSIEKGCVFDWCVSEGRFDLVPHVHHMMHCYFNSVLTSTYKKKYPFEEPEIA